MTRLPKPYAEKKTRRKVRTFGSTLQKQGRCRKHFETMSRNLSFRPITVTRHTAWMAAMCRTLTLLFWGGHGENLMTTKTRYGLNTRGHRMKILQKREKRFLENFSSGHGAFTQPSSLKKNMKCRHGGISNIPSPAFPITYDARAS